MCNSAAEVAQFIPAGDPQRLREQRLQIKNLLDSLDSLLDRPRGLDRRRYDELELESRRLRATFLASVGAVATPMPLYALWVELWENLSGQRAHCRDYEFPTIAGGGDGIYPWHHSEWMPTAPLQFDEIPAWRGADAVHLLMPPTVTDALPRNLDVASLKIGHNLVYALRRRGSSLTAWTDVPERVYTYPDVEALRADLAAMKQLRRAALRSPETLLWEVM
ncbi:hypothetical protein AB0C34_17235 [Nocardia sp. NPDC049220]|uniref:hypothetical protein n=1 Tax=Nocardia sp. NPDC049220 TaxID=3155273 RepID=UPI0033C4F7AF